MMEWVRRHRGLVAMGAGVVAAMIVFVLVWFQPQKLFIDTAVDEELPAERPGAAEQPAPTTTVREGSFETIDKDTSGRVAVVDVDGERILRFEDFRTSNGPDLVVYLSSSYPRDSGDTSVAEDFVDLGQLKGNVGAQNYEIPPGADLDRYSSVIVWCRRFNVTFGAARLA